MPEIDWEAVDRLAQPLYPDDPICDWARAHRVVKQTAYVAQGLKPFDHTLARLLAVFHGIAGATAEPTDRREWTQSLLAAGIPLETQMRLWISLDRYLHAPETHEECAVRDACLLETVGALGVAMAMLRAGQTGVSLKAAIESAHAAVGSAQFFTPAGRRLGVRRIVAAKRFLKELEEE